LADKIHTFGYSGHDPSDLARRLEETGATLIDIRYSPRSRNPVWSRKRLEEAFGERYVHCPELGNRNYRNGGPVEIADYEAGRDLLKGIPGPVLLMCACKDPKVCHRTVVAEQLRNDGMAVEAEM
jgi:uncharacterized protein (DUF488 family)